MATGVDWLVEAIDAGTEIVTANRRLARALSHRYAQYQVERGTTAWLTPAVIYWRDWLGRLVDTAASRADIPRVLDRQSAALLWERSVAGRFPGSLPGLGGLARDAERAWQRLTEWQVSLGEAASAARSEEERLFVAAAADFRDLLAERCWIESSQLGNVVVDLLRTEPGLAPGRIRFAGFDKWTPLGREVLTALNDCGSEVIVDWPAARSSRVAVESFESEFAELRAAGAWAREILSRDPSARVGIVCPALESAPARVGRLVSEGALPGWQYAHPDLASRVNVSYGRRLADYPIIAAALLALRWTSRGLFGRELSVLIRSPFFGNGDPGIRGRLELRLRRFPDRAWAAKQLAAALRGTPEAGEAEGVLAAIDVVCRYGRDGVTDASPIVCARRIDAFLTETGWPGADKQDSTGFQLLNRWRELLNEFARVAGVQPVMSFPAAIDRIGKMARETIWQPESEAADIQVLGMLEAAGLEFDHLWISGLDAGQWPPPDRPSPMLARALQKKYGMPGSVPEIVLEDAWTRMQRLLGSADDAVVSWARVRDDTEMLPSPLLERLDATPYDGPADPGWTVREATSPVQLETIPDDRGPPVAPGEQVRGGAYTLQKQLVEPFMAFAAGRLAIRQCDAFACGLSPAQRGEIMHEALHNLLADKPDQRQIRDWLPADRIRRVGAAIDAALAPHQRTADGVLGRLISIERARLQRILLQFIDEERSRLPFRVASLEASLPLERHSIRLGFRVDRVDELDDGRLVVVDYKTGRAGHFRARDGGLVEAQIVAYSLAVGGTVGGLAYAHLDSREVRWFGAGPAWGDDEADWSKTLADWQDTVDVAFRGLADGDVRVDVRRAAADARPHAILSRVEEQKRDR